VRVRNSKFLFLGGNLDIPSSFSESYAPNLKRSELLKHACRIRKIIYFILTSEVVLI